MNALKGRARACTSCRQVKLRCNAKETFPSPCTRCTAQGLDCKLDSNFKRVPAKRQQEEVSILSKKISDLQKSLGLDNERDVSPGNAASGSHSVNWHHSRSNGSPTIPLSSHQAAEAPAYSQTEKWLQIEGSVEGSWTVGDLTLNARDVMVLLREFDEKLYRHLPILEPCTSIHALHQLSKTLFWTILLVSCSGPLNSRTGEYYKMILPYQQKLLALDILGPPSLQTLQATLISCVWPAPLRSQYDDPCWTLCGVAVNMAMQMGFHHPEHTAEYFRPHDPLPATVDIRRRTWLACFQLSTSLSTWFGLPPVLNSTSHLDTIAILCRTHGIPRTLQARVEIQRHVVRYTAALEGQLDPRTRHSLIPLFDQDLSQVQQAFLDVWTSELDIELQGAKLHLYAFCFLPSVSPTELQFSRAGLTSQMPIVLLQLGLTAAVRLVHISCRLRRSDETAASADPSGLLNYPKHFWRVLAFSAFFLLQFLAVDTQASESDRELARNHVSAMHRLFMSYPSSPEHIRAGKSIELVGRMPHNTGDLTFSRVFTRLGSSFLHNALHNCMIYGDRRNLGSASPEATPEPSNGGLTQDSTEAQPMTESLFPEDSYQILQEVNGDEWEIPFGVWNNEVYDQFNVGMNFDEGFHNFGIPFQ